MEVVKLNSNVPIKAIPEAELNRIIIQELSVWLAGILSLSDETSADRLEKALPAVKEHCWSMGFSEIKTMFEMYADNKLSIKPRSNYFDRVLFGQIVEAYKAQKRPKPTPYHPTELSEQEKSDLIYTGLINCYDAWYQEKRVVPGYQWVYDHLDELKIIAFSKEEKLAAMEEAKKRIKYKQSLLDRVKEEIETTPAHISEAKRILLEQYFNGVTKDKFIKSITWK